MELLYKHIGKVKWGNCASGIMVVLLPLMVGCSVLSGKPSYSDNPAIASQQRRIELLESELKEQERIVAEAKARQKAAEDRLSAAKHELEAMEVD